MPLYPPRVEPIKKKEQLAQREIEFLHTVKNNFEKEKLNKAVEKYRMAQLSILKARIHELREKEFQKEPYNGNLKKFEDDILDWTNKSTDNIINEFKVIHVR